MFLIRDLVSPRTWLAMIHHLAGLLIGLPASCIAVFGVVYGFCSVPLALVGLPLLGITLRLTGWLARAERARFGFLLGARIPVWPTGAQAGIQPGDQSGYRWGVIPRWRTLRSRQTWGAVGYAVARPFVSVAAVALTVAFWSYGLVMVTLPVYNTELPAGGAEIGGTVFRGPGWMALSVLGGLLLVLVAPQQALGFAKLDTALTRWLLSPPSDLAQRRRIERDLHDGAQQRLVALAMELGRARAKFADDVDAARLLVDQAHAQAKEALTELRNLVRGMHPPVLTERGLDAALSGLAALCPVPVDIRVDVPVRPKPSIEAVAYFMVAEALTNVAKHSRASHAHVIVEGHGYPGSLTVMISDDGIGGADPNGTGLSGLAGRVSGVDGTLSVESPSGGPTIIAAELPCA